MPTDAPTSVTSDLCALRSDLEWEIDRIIRDNCPEIGDGAYAIDLMTPSGRRLYAATKRRLAALDKGVREFVR